MLLNIEGNTDLSSPTDHGGGMNQKCEAEVPRYPPARQGLPAVPAVKLLDTQQALLRGIADHAIATPEIHQRFYLPAIERFAAFVHLLPASEAHHHRGAGGLLRHSLEAGFWALQSADKLLLDAARTPAIRREMEPRWQLAVFLAALCHDVGKPVTDLVVTDREGTMAWNPLKENVDAWAVRSGIDAYFLHWRKGRSRQHTVLAALIADRIIGKEVLVWIGEGGMNLIVWMLESFNNNPGTVNPLHELVVRADQTSVERDLRSFGIAAGHEVGIPVERCLTDIMRRFVQEGVWRINEPGARLWKIQGKLYLVWPAAGEEMARQIREDMIPGMPGTPDALLDMMIERRMALLRSDSASEEQLWHIAPACLVKQIPTLRLTAIQLQESAIVSSTPIPSVEGNILNRDRESTLRVAEVSAPIPVPEDPNPDPGSPRQEVLLLEGEVIEALRQLAQDLRCGKKQWGVDAVLSSEGQILLPWPQAFDCCELAPHRILGELSERNGLWSDPMTPLKKVFEVELGGQRMKVIRLKREFVDQMFSDALDDTGFVPDSENAPFGTLEDDTKQFERATPDRTDLAEVGHVEQVRSQTPKISTGLSLDEIIAALSKFPAAVQADGWRRLPKFEALSACRQAGIRLSHARLDQLSRLAPNQFVLEGVAIKFRA